MSYQGLPDPVSLIGGEAMTVIRSTKSAGPFYNNDGIPIEEHHRRQDFLEDLIRQRPNPLVCVWYLIR